MQTRRGTIGEGRGIEELLTKSTGNPLPLSTSLLGAITMGPLSPAAPYACAARFEY